MRQAYREFRRAPARIITSVLALALALGAMGVFAIPAVASSSLRETVGRDRMADLVLSTTDTGTTDVVAIAESIDGVEGVRAEVAVAVGTGPVRTGAALLPLVGRDLDDHDVDVISATSGRLPSAANEVLVADGVAEVGETIEVTTSDQRRRALVVVCLGGTSFWAG